MSAETDALSLVRTTFPGREELIGRVFRESRSFRELCEDYRKCVSALHRWERPPGSGASPRRQEYRELMAELGQEIEGWLNAVDQGSLRPGRRVR